MSRIGLAGALAVAAVALVTAQEVPTFRGGTELVSVYATVTDRDGRLVTDLTRDDFEVRDNGRRQTLTVFTNDLQPFSAVVMIDRSGSMAGNFELVRQAAATFVDHLLEGDRLRIGSFSQDIILSPDTFTSDREELMAILREDLQDVGGSPVWTAIDHSIAALSGEPGRRVVLIFSDGEDTRSAKSPSPVDVDLLIRRAQQHDVMVYAIGFNIIETERVAMPGRPGSRPPIFVPRPFPGGVGFPVTQWSRTMTRTKVKPPHPGLGKLAGESGGGYFAMSSSASLDAIFARVAEELHRQYWLGFTPTSRDGKAHRLEVRVRRSGLTVRARRDYVAAQR